MRLHPKGERHILDGYYTSVHLCYASSLRVNACVGLRKDLPKLRLFKTYLGQNLDKINIGLRQCGFCWAVAIYKTCVYVMRWTHIPFTVPSSVCCMGYVRGLGGCFSTLARHWVSLSTQPKECYLVRSCFSNEMEIVYMRH